METKLSVGLWGKMTGWLNYFERARKSGERMASFCSGATTALSAILQVKSCRPVRRGGLQNAFVRGTAEADNSTVRRGDPMCDCAIRGGPSVSRARSSAWLHALAAGVLGIFALSHLAGFAAAGAGYAPLNLVIPYLSDAQVFFVAGVFELGVAWLCWRWRGDSKASVMILLFVGLMVWYRLSLEWLGAGAYRAAVVSG
ncbi:MAG: hypothetical protein NZ739_12145 [Verrucomicrobiae bacterium]|nr:hypothetical protein [Verrucomicrobiae bacterium]